MPYSQKQVDQLMLLQAFATLHEVMPSAAKVLDVLGDEHFYEYCRLQEGLRKLWHEVGKNL